LPRREPSNPWSTGRGGRRRSSVLPKSLSVFDWVVIALLLSGTLAAVVFYGGVTVPYLGPAVGLLAAGLLVLALRPLLGEQGRELRVPAGSVAFSIFFLYAVARIPAAAVPYEAGLEALQLFSYLLAYGAWCQLLRPGKRWRVVLGVALFVLTLIAWYALIQHSRGTRMVLFEPRPEVYGMRASGTYICPNHFANLLEMALPFCFALLFCNAAGGGLRILCAYSLVLFLPVMYLTLSRSGWIGAVVGLGLTGALLALKRGKKLFWSVLVLIPLCALTLGVVLWQASTSFQERVMGSLPSAPDAAVNARLLMWRDTIEMIKEAPLFGHGGGSYQWVYPKYQSHPIQLLFDFAHNEALHVLAEHGIIGFLLLGLALMAVVLFLVRAFRTAERSRERYLSAALLGALAACLAHACFDFNFHLFGNNQLLLLLSGLVVALLQDVHPPHTVALEARPRRYLAVGVVWVGSLLLAGAMGRVYFSHRAVVLGGRAQAELDWDRAFRSYARAASIDPHYWKAYLGMGDAYQLLSFWTLDAADKSDQAARAIERYEQARERNRYDLETYLGLAKAHFVLGDAEKTKALLEHLVDFAHHDAFYLTQAALLSRRLGDEMRALEWFRRAHELQPTPVTALNIRSLQRQFDANQDR